MKLVRPVINLWSWMRRRRGGESREGGEQGGGGERREGGEQGGEGERREWGGRSVTAPNM